jgi:hypothetical protein
MTGNADKTNELEKLKMLLEYTKFHLGLYLSLLAAIVAFLSTELGPPPGSTAARLLFASVLLFALAGGFGGIIGASSVAYDSYTEFMKTRVGPWGVPLMEARTCASLEHSVFWIGVIVMLAGLWLFVREAGREDPPAIRNTLVQVEDALTRGEYDKIAAMFATEGRVQNAGGSAASGSRQIEDALKADRPRQNGPFKWMNLDISLPGHDVAIASGTLTSAKGADACTLALVRKKRDWKLLLWTCGAPAS